MINVILYFLLIIVFNNIIQLVYYFRDNTI